MTITNPYPTPDYEQVWTGVRESIQRQLANRKGIRLVERHGEDGEIYLEPEDEEDRVAKSSMTSFDHEVDPASLSISPKKAFTRANWMGWKILVSEACIHYEDLLMLGDGKMRTDGSQLLRGDVRMPAHDERKLTIQARHLESPKPLGFVATWVDGSFDGALVYDPVGVPVENFVDYHKRKDSVIPSGIDRYNDGSFRIEHQKVWLAMTPFILWLDDWVKLLAPEKWVEPKPRVPKKTKDEKLLEGEDWE